MKSSSSIRHKTQKAKSTVEKKEPPREEAAEDSIAKVRREILHSIQFELEARNRYPQIVEHVEKLSELIDLDKKRGYLGQRKGWEVCLPGLLVWPELQVVLKHVKFND